MKDSSDDSKNVQSQTVTHVMMSKCTNASSSNTQQLVLVVPAGRHPSH